MGEGEDWKSVAKALEETRGDRGNTKKLMGLYYFLIFLPSRFFLPHLLCGSVQFFLNSIPVRPVVGQ